MIPNKLPIRKIFDPTERLEAPMFQRPYVWVKEKNWVPLWETIEAVASRRLRDSKIRPYFLGTIVLEQLRTQTGRVTARQIIDGQQRLTTLQLALAAIRDLCLELNIKQYAETFANYTVNRYPLTTEPDDIFKVWPTNADRDEFRDVMRAGSVDAVKQINAGNHISQAYLYFAESFRIWLTEEGEYDLQSRINAMHMSLMDDLYLVVIDLASEDDAQEIFETLNALGTPLLPADLVKNYLIRSAEAQGLNTEQLYNHCWRIFDDKKIYWRKEIKQGRLKRPRLDLFLGHYLVMMTGEDVLINQLFSTFQDFVEESDRKEADWHMQTFRSYADVYSSFDHFPKNSREGLFFYRLSQMDISTVYPLLLELFNRLKGQNDQALHQILTDLESFLIRRMVCQLTAKNYNKFFAEMVSYLKSENDFSVKAVREYLAKQTSETSIWPRDDFFKDKWISLDFYKRLSQAKNRMILSALEAQLHDVKTEEVQIQKDLTIEHLMPDAWEEHWPITISDDTSIAREIAIKRRNESIHKVGNLTLLTQSLNPSVSNGPWDKKREAILRHSALNLNRQLKESWSENEIFARSEFLYSFALKIWPYPNMKN